MKKEDMRNAKERIIFAITEDENDQEILDTIADNVIDLMSRKIKSFEEFSSLIKIIYLENILDSLLARVSITETKLNILKCTDRRVELYEDYKNKMKKKHEEQK